ncbi:MAG TPA: hypothetical protein VGM88_34235 [Kofleriaceae bacterium]|jgi:hypothetical protein
MGTRTLLAAVAACCALRATAAARPASTGWFAEAGFGAGGFLPSASDDAKVGPAIDVRIGRDLFSWLSVGIFAAMTSHEATTPPPPTGQWFQLYRGGADVRLGAKAGPIAFFAEGGAGAAIISSNILEKVGITDPGERASIEFQAGVGLEYQTENRHYAFGVAGDLFLIPQFDALRGVDVHAYIRYTY